MKKILLASTMLVGTAGFAAADVSMNGSARFGAIYNGTSWSLTDRFTLNVMGTGTTSNGLEFGAKIRMRASNGGVTAINAPYAWVGMGGFKLRVGNTAGAIDVMPNLYSNGVGLTGLGWDGIVANHSGAPGFWGWDGYSSAGAGNQSVALDYSVGNLSATASRTTATSAQPNYTGVSVSYKFNNFTGAVGYQDDGVAGATPNDMIIASIAGSFGDFGGNIQYASFGNADSKFVVGASYSMNAVSANAFYASEAGSATASTYGLGVYYDLGGGAKLKGGVARNNAATTVADFGISMSF